MARVKASGRTCIRFDAGQSPERSFRRAGRTVDPQDDAPLPAVGLIEQAQLSAGIERHVRGERQPAQGRLGGRHRALGQTFEGPLVADRNQERQRVGICSSRNSHRGVKGCVPRQCGLPDDAAIGRRDQADLPLAAERMFLDVKFPVDRALFGDADLRQEIDDAHLRTARRAAGRYRDQRATDRDPP